MTPVEESALLTALAERQRALAAALLDQSKTRAQIEALRHAVERVQACIDRAEAR